MGVVPPFGPTFGGPLFFDNDNSWKSSTQQKIHHFSGHPFVKFPRVSVFNIHSFSENILSKPSKLLASRCLENEGFLFSCWKKQWFFVFVFPPISQNKPKGFYGTKIKELYLNMGEIENKLQSTANKYGMYINSYQFWGPLALKGVSFDSLWEWKLRVERRWNKVTVQVSKKALSVWIFFGPAKNSEWYLFPT